MHIAFGGKLLGTARTGIHPNIFASAFPQGCNGGTRIGTRAEDKCPPVSPVFLGHSIGQIKGNRHNRTPLRPDGGVLAYLAGGVCGVFKELHQLTRHGASLLGGGERPPHLPGNFSFTNYRRFQARGHGEKVLGGFEVAVHLKAAADDLLGESGLGGDMSEYQLAHGGQVLGDCQFYVHFEAVAGCQHHGPFNPQLTGGVAFECFGHTGGTVAQ